MDQARSHRAAGNKCISIALMWILWSHIAPACDCQPSANSTLLVVASTVENFVLIHFMGKDRNLGARWLQ